ncbi:MAG: FIST C-terminal domain-containing protein [Deltaproteobacteria bacterium]|nr:FIST C-terminal domain-containing protein [Deltaproteobacteria bacterium]
MLKAGVGQSSQSETHAAIEEAARGAMAGLPDRNADLAVLYATVDHAGGLEQELAALQRITGTRNVVGCSGLGILTDSGEIEGDSGVAVMALASDTLRARPFIRDALKGNDAAAGQDIANAVGADSPSLTVLLADGYRSRPDTLLEGMASAGHASPVVGAGASENGSHGRTYQFYEDRVTSNSVVGFALSGAGTTAVELTQGCQPVGEPMVITKAHENLIFEINDRPAFEVFVDLIGKPFQQDLRRALAFVFVGLSPDPLQTEIEPGQYLVRNIIGLDAQRGILAVAQPVEAGQALIFTLRDGQRAREDLRQMLERQTARLEGRTPRLGLYFNCCARGSGLYGVPGIDTAYIKHALADVPVIGFFGNYEIGPMAGGNHLLTYTGVLALVTD